MKTVVIIPARYDSTRLPGKALIDIAGKTMIKRVYERAKQAVEIDDVIVATDDKRIYEKVKSFSGKVEMTGEHPTGTDRIAEVAKNLEADLIVNVQGDEPLLNPAMVDDLIRPFSEDKELKMATLKKEVIDSTELDNPNLVKVITDKNDFALYFSRAKIPYLQKEATDYYKHIGLYAYRKDFLLNYTNLDSTPLEKAESLEQLRALEHGYKIKVVETEYDSLGVDTEEDLAKVRKKLGGGN